MKIDVLIYSIDTDEECIPRDMPMERTIKIKEFRPCCREVVKAKNVDIKFAEPEDETPTLVLISRHVDYSWVIRLIGKNIKRSNSARFVVNQLKSMC